MSVTKYKKTGISEYESTSIVSRTYNETILSEASCILSGDRQDDYGDYIKNFDNISKESSRWSGKEQTPLDCVNVLIATKICREQYNSKRDNMVDLAAYLQIRNDIINGMNNEK